MMIKIKKIIAIYRITDWLHYLGFVLMGFTLRTFHINVINFESLFLILFFSSLLLAYAYSLNDYFDEKSKKKYYLLPLVFSVALLPFLNFSQILLGIIFLVLVTLYSFKGISLMKFPVVSTLLNSVGFMLIFVMGYIAEGDITISGFIFFFLLFIYETVAQLIHEKVHLAADTEFGRKTSVFYLGNKLTPLIRAMLALTVPLSLFLLFETDFIFFVFACILFSLLFFIMAGKIDKKLRKRYKLAGIIVGLFFLLDYLLNILFVF